MQYLFRFFRYNVADSYVVKANTKVIASKAFNGNANLVKIELPESLVAISANAFVDCFRLIEVYNKSDIVIQAGVADKDNSTKSGNVGLYALNVYDDANETKLVKVVNLSNFENWYKSDILPMRKKEHFRFWQLDGKMDKFGRFRGQIFF